MTNFLKNPKNPFWDHVAILAFSGQIWTKMNFPGKTDQSVFKYSNYLSSCQKSEKTNIPFLRKMLNRQMDGQADNHDFVGPSVRRGSNY